jgi:hypothetical protein
MTCGDRKKDNPGFGEFIGRPFIDYSKLVGSPFKSTGCAAL